MTEQYWFVTSEPAYTGHHEISRDDLRALLYPENDIEIIGEAGTVAEHLKLDVILMDIRSF